MEMESIFIKHTIVTRIKNSCIQKISLINFTSNLRKKISLDQGISIKKFYLCYFIDQLFTKNLIFYQNSFIFRSVCTIVNIFISYCLRFGSRSKNFLKKIFKGEILDFRFFEIEKKKLEEKLLTIISQDHVVISKGIENNPSLREIFSNKIIFDKNTEHFLNDFFSREKKKETLKILFYKKNRNIIKFKKLNTLFVTFFSNKFFERQLNLLFTIFSYYIYLNFSKLLTTFNIKKHWFIGIIKNVISTEFHFKVSSNIEHENILKKNSIFLKARKFVAFVNNKKFFFSRNSLLNFKDFLYFNDKKIDTVYKYYLKKNNYTILNELMKFFQNEKHSVFKIFPKKFLLKNKKMDYLYTNLELSVINRLSKCFLGLIGIKKKILIKSNAHFPNFGGQVASSLSFIGFNIFSRFYNKSYRRMVEKLDFILFSYTNDIILFKNIKSILFSQIIVFLNWPSTLNHFYTESFFKNFSSLFPYKIDINRLDKIHQKCFYKNRIEIELKVNLLSQIFFFSNSVFSLLKYNLVFDLYFKKYLVYIDNFGRNGFFYFKIKNILKMTPMYIGSLAVGFFNRKDLCMLSLRKINNKEVRHCSLFFLTFFSLIGNSNNIVFENFFKNIIEFGKKKKLRYEQIKYYKCIGILKEYVDEKSRLYFLGNDKLYYEESLKGKVNGYKNIENNIKSEIIVKKNLETDFLDNIITGVNFVSIFNSSNKILFTSIFKFLLFNPIFNYKKSSSISFTFFYFSTAVIESIDILTKSMQKSECLENTVLSMTLLGFTSKDTRVYFLLKYILNLELYNKKNYFKRQHLSLYDEETISSDLSSNVIFEYSVKNNSYSCIENLKIKDNVLFFIRISQGALFINKINMFSFFNKNQKKIDYKKTNLIINLIFLFLSKFTISIENFPLSIFILCLCINKNSIKCKKKIRLRTLKLKIS